MRSRDRLSVVLASGWIPVFGCYALLALNKEVAANWPVAGYCTAFAATGYLFGRESAGKLKHRLLAAAVIVAFAVQIPFFVDDVLYRAALPFIRGGRRARILRKLDQTNRLRGCNSP